MRHHQTITPEWGPHLSRRRLLLGGMATGGAIALGGQPATRPTL